MSGPNPTTNRFHPVGWANLNNRAGGGQGFHAWEAQRNLNACVSCHTERDCAVCHASSGRGGLNVNPHPPAFNGDCKRQFARNGRPCLVCHDIQSAELVPAGSTMDNSRRPHAPLALRPVLGPTGIPRKTQQTPCTRVP